jgi:fumarylacetoacetase
VSFIEISGESHFSLQNLPYGVFSPNIGGERRVGVRIGDYVLDLAALEAAGWLPTPDKTFTQPSLNAFMALGRPVWKETRAVLQNLLSADNPKLRDHALRETALLPIDTVTLHLPVEIGDYTDFYSSKEHATNVGIMFRGKDNALMPNWLHIPIAYHGRASSVVVSGTDIHRPYGQTKANDAPSPTFAPSREMDFELEMGFFVSQGNTLGEPIPIEKAYDHIFGMVLVNDWSARDIQRWEYQPLGPFLSKNLATSISPWVVTMEALEPFRCASPAQDPQPLPYLRTTEDWAYDIQLEIGLQSAAMQKPQVITHSNYRYLYWNMCQQLTHHTITGCNMRSGDLLASGTISGSTPDSYGSLLELTWRGTQPINLPTGETRAFLEDGDRLTMTGWCQGDGYRVGFGEVTGRLLPAR